MRAALRRTGIGLLATCVLLLARVAAAQSPELSMREFASGQIKKGVRAIGMGGNGATLGNYGLVYEGHDTAVVDAGVTVFDNGNLFQFTAAGITTPNLWHGLVIYVLGMAQTATAIHLDLKDPNLGPVPLHAIGDGGDQLLALRLAMPLGHGFSMGIQLTYELSQFDAMLEDQSTIRYRTQWLPSGGLGIAYQPNDRWLIGTRVILNHDWERRVDAFGVAEGLNRSYEFRLGAAVAMWRGSLLDAGGTMLVRYNQINDAGSIVGGINLGFEQAFWGRAFVIRTGVDECQIGFGSACSFTAGLSFKKGPVNVDLAYLYDLGAARIGTLFGVHSNSALATLTFNYGWFYRRRGQPTQPAETSSAPKQTAAR